MKKHITILSAAVLCLSLVSSQGQAGGPAGPRGPRFNAGMKKLFGENTAFTANAEMQLKESSGETMTMPGRFAFDDGKSRFEMNLTEAKGGGMNPAAMQHLKSMGMDRTISISRPEKKIAYTIYPSLNAYAETPIQDPDAGKPDSSFKVETTELGKETVDGHPCVKNKAVVTDDKGEKHESIIWNATDLKKFPIKIETQDHGNTMTMLFKDVKLTKPSASEFEPPSDFKKYNSPMELMREEMMKKMGGGGMSMPPGHP